MNLIKSSQGYSFQHWVGKDGGSRLIQLCKVVDSLNRDAPNYRTAGEAWSRHRAADFDIDLVECSYQYGCIDACPSSGTAGQVLAPFVGIPGLLMIEDGRDDKAIQLRVGC